MEYRYMVWNDLKKEFQFPRICETTEKGAIERLQSIFYSDFGKGKIKEIVLYESSIRDVRILLNLIKKLESKNKKKSVVAEVNIELDDMKQYINKEIKELMIENYIPKQKIKDKIEELDEELKAMKVDNMYGRYKEYGGKSKWEILFARKYGMHDILQDLLKEGEK